MKLKEFFTKNWTHFAVVLFVIVVAVVYFKPQIDGYGLKQHDVDQWRGMAHETEAYRDKTGEEPLWTNSMFGGMPTEQISLKYPGNYIKLLVDEFFDLFPLPMGTVILHLIGFYILALFLRIKPVIGLIGAIAFSFASYEIIILQAGHLTKANAVAFMAPLLGAFIYTYRENRWKGMLFCAVFMALELCVNHVQVTYYFMFVLLFVGIYFLYEAIIAKQIKAFLLTSVGIGAAFILALAINIGNIALTTDYAKHTIRGGNDVTITPEGKPVTNHSSGLDKDYITQWSYGKGETFTLLSPNVKGGGSFTLGGSQFEEIVDNSEFTGEEMAQLKNYPAYWGEQPFTSGPVYIGIVVCFLAFLGLIYIKSKIKWALLAGIILAILLSWGKNFMGLTNFFIDYIPGYNKFRTVTIILVLVELCIPVLAVMFLDQLLKEKEEIQANKKKFFISLGIFVGFLIIVRIAGLGDHFSSKGDKSQLLSVESGIRKQIAGMDPSVLMTQYKLDITNTAQLDAFVKEQADPYYKNFDNLKTIRESIFNSSMNRSILFSILVAGLLLVFFYTSVSALVVSVGILALILFDVVPVSYQYIGEQEEGNTLKYWTEVGKTKFPLTPTSADDQIMEAELRANPSLAAKIDKAEKEGAAKANELDYFGQIKNNVVQSYRFEALNFASNYRVFDVGGGFSSSRVSYFHKSLGGYHGAKLRNINNVYDFHLTKMNYKVYDMLNVKYFIQNTETGEVATPNPTALGNAWFVRSIESYATPNDEIRALSSKLKLTNSGKGTMLINGEVKKDATIYGAEKLAYLIPGKDTITIPLSRELREGMEVLFVMDVNGKTNLIPALTAKMDTFDSFTTLVKIKVVNEFKPSEEAVMLKVEAQKLSAKKFSGEGEIRLLKYAPNKLLYEANAKGKQLAVFSEIYYPNGWEAYIDGKKAEIRKVDYLLRGLEIPSGKHKVEFRYYVSKYAKANTIAAISSIVLFLGFIALFYFERKKKTV